VVSKDNAILRIVIYVLLIFKNSFLCLVVAFSSRCVPASSAVHLNIEEIIKYATVYGRKWLFYYFCRENDLI